LTQNLSSIETLTPADLGWTNTQQTQLSLDEFSETTPVRVVAVHRSGLDVLAAGASPDHPTRGVPWPDEGEPTVGDWLLVEREGGRPIRLLDRTSLIRRRAPGTDRRIQFIAANVDTLFVVTSCNRDFNIARLERYLAVAQDAGATPVIVLTKSDLADETGAYVDEARSLVAGLMVETVDARDPASVAVLEPWCGRGQTVALVGSSGVGKTTLTNTLIGDGHLATAGIREDDAKGRHTTTGREMHRLVTGGWVIDTPGMRELQLVDAEAGLAEVFADVTELAASCRFNDCSHSGEPGCAVTAAIERGDLDPARLKRYRKLVAEDLRNSQSIHEARARDKQFGKMVKSIVAAKDRRRGR